MQGVGWGYSYTFLISMARGKQHITMCDIMNWVQKREGTCKWSRMYMAHMLLLLLSIANAAISSDLSWIVTDCGQDSMLTQNKFWEHWICLGATPFFNLSKNRDDRMAWRPGTRGAPSPKVFNSKGFVNAQAYQTLLIFTFWWALLVKCM